MEASARLQESGAALRARGLRSTPQRRAILAAFTGGGAEHLSAEEVYARATTMLPGLGRGTVYATLAEYTEVGLLAAVGAPEPVRYETNTAAHAHFRCERCRRILDAPTPELGPEAALAPGQRVDRVEVMLEGVCGDCLEFCAGLEAGVAEMHATGAGGELLAGEPGAGTTTLETPLGRLLIAATAAGLARIALPEHGDAPALVDLIDRAGPAAQSHLDAARAQLESYFAHPARACAPVEVVAVPGASRERLGAALATLADVGPGEVRSYHELDGDLGPRELGVSFGANPLAILGPCHRVDCGASAPAVYVGGPERRLWLRAHERRAIAGQRA